jgi:hypothetical protein
MVRSLQRLADLRTVLSRAPIFGVLSGLLGAILMYHDGETFGPWFRVLVPPKSVRAVHRCRVCSANQCLGGNHGLRYQDGA